MAGSGGAREGSGPKPTWEHLPADKTIKVPSALARDIQRVAHIVDELVAQGFTVEEVIAALEELRKR
jgi:hypothetical protein